MSAKWNELMAYYTARYDNYRPEPVITPVLLTRLEQFLAPVGNDFFLVVHPDSLEEVLQANDWIHVVLYSGVTPTLPKELGRLGNFRVCCLPIDQPNEEPYVREVGETEKLCTLAELVRAYRVHL